MDNYQLLIQKLDQFIRKYYLNQVLRGVLYSIGLILLLFLTISLLEYFFYFGKGGRKLLFYSFIGASIVALIGWVGIPLLHYFRLGKIIDHKQAAKIIGEHFVDVKDKLLNILQLKDQAVSSPNAELVFASINQKSESIKLVPFRHAIDLGKNRKYLRYALPPLLLLLVLLVAAPYTIKDPTQRLLRNNEDFERPAPFQFVLDDTEPQVMQFGNYPLSVHIEGEQLPNEVFIEVDNYQYRMTKETPDLFTYSFNNVQQNTDFKLYSGPVNSRVYTLKVLEKPNLTDFEVKLDYPGYTGRNDETLNSIGDLAIPQGTKIDWVFTAQHTDQLELKFGEDGEREEAKRFSDDLFTYERRAMHDEQYRLFIGNEFLPQADSVSYTLSVIPDRHPSIQVEQFQDSTEKKLLYFIGEANDDYGLRNLSFNYRITSQDGKQGEINRVPIAFPAGKATQYEHIFDVRELALKPGDELIYYFEIFDNDAINGSKSAQTNVAMYSVPSLEELEALGEKNEEDIKESLKKALEDSEKIKQEMKDVREKILQKKELDWQDRKELEKLLERQKEVQQQMEDAREKFEENKNSEDEFQQKDESIQEDEEKLQELFEDALDEEMQELMEQIQELLQELDKEQALEKLEEMESSYEERQTKLDRLSEIYKQLELEKAQLDAIEKLEELAEKQEKLAEQTKNQEKSQEQLAEEQEKLEEEMEDVEKKMEKIQEKNKELEKPKDIPKREEQMEDIQQDMNNSKENIQQKKNDKASRQQKNAAQKMKDMANAMSQQMEGQEQEKLEEDMATLRQLMENLVGISFNQEDLMNEFKSSRVNTPRYVDLTQQQFKLQDDFRMVEDSLNELAKRVIQIESFVTEKVTEIKTDFRKGVDDLEERRKPQATEHQQRVMKNVNDLALMLSEIMNSMQQQMANMKTGDQMCQNPGNKPGQKPGRKPSDKPGGSSEQKELNDAMKKMKDGKQKGEERGSAKEFAEMAARQAAIRKALEQQQKDRQQKGKGTDPKLQELIDHMNQSEIDLVNKRLTNQMMKRQQEILSRMLEHEKAEREQEYDNKRKAEVAREKKRELPPPLQEYLRKREAEIEQYRAVNPNLKPYYKFLVEEYFKTLQENPVRSN